MKRAAAMPHSSVVNRSIAALAVGVVLLLTSCGIFGDDDQNANNALRPGPAEQELSTNQPAVAGVEAQVDQLVAVVGIPLGEGLPVAVLPGSDNIIGELPAGTADTYYIGETKTDDAGQVWWWVRRDRLQGWVQPGLAFPAQRLDVTAEALRVFDGSRPEAATIDALAIAVSSALSPVEGSAPIISSKSFPNEQEEVVVTVDVVGDPDQAIAANRFEVTAGPRDAVFEMRKVTRTNLCATAEADGVCQ